MTPNVIRLVAVFDERAAMPLRETAISGKQRVIDLADGRVCLEAIVPDTVELRTWLRVAAVRLALSMQLGGAIGNVVDRLTMGKVVDFVLVHYGTWYFPAFNVADSAITVGAGLLILESFLHREPHRDARSGKASGADVRKG